MIDERIRSEAGVCLVGGGDVCPEVIAKALKFAPTIIAADGGADAALSMGLQPFAVIGDLDSLSPDSREKLTCSSVIEVAEQDTTDFEKCLSLIEAPFVLACGFTGKRLDHTLSALSVVARHIGPPTVLVDHLEAVFAPSEPVELDVPEGTRVSLFPLAPVSGRSKGLRWPIDDLVLDPQGRVGTSNIATGKITLEFDQPGMLVILPASELAKIIELLRD